MTTDKARAEAERIVDSVRGRADRMTVVCTPEGEARAQDQINTWYLNAIAAALTARDAEAAAKLARVEAALAKWQHEAEGLREAVKVLREVEWIRTYEEESIKSVELCPFCFNDKRNGHTPACRLIAALDAAGGA
jgi:hypothetical protein